MMRVLYFHQHFVTPRGAGAVRSYMMARRLIEGGHQVTMVCGTHQGGTAGLDGPFMRGSRRGNVEGIDVIELDLAYSNNHGLLRRTSTFLKFALTSIFIALREPCDVVFATTTPLTAGIPGIVARWFRGKPFVFEVRDLWPELPRAMGIIRSPAVLGALSALEWASYRSADRLIGLSPGIIKGICRRGVAADRVHMIPNGCDVDIFSAPDDPWRPAGVTMDDLLAVFAGTHGVANGLDAVLDAAAVLRRRGRDDIKILLIGDGKLKTRLVERARREDLANVLFESPVNKRRLAGLMLQTNLGLQVLANVPAFYYGTSPNKFFDYLAAGLPVLNNYPGWVADMILEHECGYAVPPNNAEAFADALQNAADNRDALRAMGNRSRVLATQFRRADLADAWVAAVQSALPGSTGSAASEKERVT